MQFSPIEGFGSVHILPKFYRGSRPSTRDIAFFHFLRFFIFNFSNYCKHLRIILNAPAASPKNDLSATFWFLTLASLEPKILIIFEFPEFSTFSNHVAFREPYLENYKRYRADFFYILVSDNAEHMVQIKKGQTLYSIRFSFVRHQPHSNDQLFRKWLIL